MKKQMSVVIAIVATLLATLLNAAPLQEEMVVEGMLANVDIETQMVSIKTTNDEEMNLKCVDDTKIVGPQENLQGLKDKIGTRLRISYKLIEEKAQAVRVEILE